MSNLCSLAGEQCGVLHQGESVKGTRDQEGENDEAYELLSEIALLLLDSGHLGVVVRGVVHDALFVFLN